MAQALITINAVQGSNIDLPINTLVQLNNVNNGGETTYAWTILDQPPGTADALSNAAIQNPTFTPKKEGTYHIQLVVNGSLTNKVVAAIKQLKSRLRVPAAGETTEADASDGWAVSADEILRKLDAVQADPGVIVGVAGAAGLTRGNILKVTNNTVIKSGLPGQETVPSFVLAPATTADAPFNGLLGILEGGVDGSSSPASGALIRVRIFGQFGTVAGALTSGPLYVSDTGVLSSAPGTNSRLVGHVSSGTGAAYYAHFRGV